MTDGALFVTAPGNLLLFGEYVVTLEGGLGIACAVEPRVRGLLFEKSGFSIRGTGGGEEYFWSTASRPDTPTAPLLTACVEAVLDITGNSRDDLEAIGQRLEIDSSALFRRDGTKRGLGSSAASAVVTTAALLYLLRSGSRCRRPSRLK